MVCEKISKREEAQRVSVRSFIFVCVPHEKSSVCLMGVLCTWFNTRDFRRALRAFMHAEWGCFWPLGRFDMLYRTTAVPISFFSASTTCSCKHCTIEQKNVYFQFNF